MKLGLWVGIGPGQIVLDGDTDPPPPRGTAPNFCPISVAAKWLDGPMPLGRKVSLDLGNIVLDGDPDPPPQKGGRGLQFRPIFIVPKRLDGSRCHLIRR